MTVTASPGEIPEVDSALLWLKMIRLLQHKDYSYEVSIYGNLDEFAEKVAYFFHSCLQGLEAEEGALELLRTLPLWENASGSSATVALHSGTNVASFSASRYTSLAG